jgi:hypothetical protein
MTQPGPTDIPYGPAPPREALAVGARSAPDGRGVILMVKLPGEPVLLIPMSQREASDLRQVLKQAIARVN